MTKAVAALLAGAILALGQTPKPVLGTVTGFKNDALQLGVKADSGSIVWVKLGPGTEVVMVAPGEKDFSKSRPAQLTDIARDDRVLVSYISGMTEARRIVLMSAGAIARRDAAEKDDWEKRGISGVVAALDGNQITLETRSLQGAQRTTVAVTPKTVIRRYAPDSVKFVEAQPATLADVAVGDQLRTRGNKSEDGARLTADDVVFGTFLTTVGSISEVNREAGEIKIVDAVTRNPLTIRVTADTQMKKMPELRDILFSRPKSGDAHSADHPPANMSQMLQSLPAGTIDDLKAGSSVIVTSTRGARPDRVTGIMVIANIDALLQMAQSQAGGANPLDTLNRMHGGMLGGPGGISLPVIGQ